jgi:hypothetical protein
MKTETAQEIGKRLDDDRKNAANKARDLKTKTSIFEKAQDEDTIAKAKVKATEEDLRQLLRK